MSATAPLSWTTQQRAVSALKGCTYNPRRMSAAGKERLLTSLRKFNLVDIPVVNADDTILSGHQRVALLILEDRAAELIDVRVPNRMLTEEEAKEYMLQANNHAGEWDQGLLATHFTDTLKDTALGMEDLLKDLPVLELPGSEPDDVPALQEYAVTITGDVWMLGNHRIICGDCRNHNDVEKLLNGNTINVAFTSPPYASQRKYDEASGFKPIHPDEFVEWYRDVAANIMAHLAADGSYFCNIKPHAEGLDTHLYVFDLVLAHVRQWGWHFATEFCWERNGVPKQVTRRFKSQFEPIYQFATGDWKMRPSAVMHESDGAIIPVGKGGGATTWDTKKGSGGVIPRRRRNSGTMARRQGSDDGGFIAEGVLGMAYPGNRLPTFTSSHEALGHSAAFPVGLPEFFIKAYSDRGDRVFDPFMGSGSTLIAAEKNGRVGYGTEISPKYVDVIVKRWQSYTGKEAVHEASGRTFNAMLAERQPATA